MKTLTGMLDTKTRAAFAALMHLSWPEVVTRVGIMFMALIDTIVVGHHSSAQLAFLMMAQSLFWVPAMSGMGLLMGVQVKTSHYLGSGETHRIGAVFQRGMGYALVMGVSFMTLLLVAGVGFLDFAVTPAMAQGARLPIILFAISLPLFMPSIVCTQFLEALGRTRDTMMATLAANAVNIALLLLLVPGHVSLFGIHFHGAMGAVTATLIARTLQSAGMLIYVLSLKDCKPYGLLRAQPADHEGAVEQRHVGYAAGASYFIEISAFAGMTLFAGRLGEQVVASWAIILNFASLVFMVPMGLSVGCSVLVGRAYGARDAEGLARTGRVSFVSAALFMLAVVAGVLLFSGVIARLYSDDQMLLPTVQAGLLLSCLFFVPDGLQVVSSQALRARKDVLFPTIVHYISYGAIMLPLGFVFCLTLGWGISGLIWAIVVASFIAGTCQTARFLWLDHTQLAKA
ncbi:MAG: MATE family efflux transporter [Asticcacaulis sp.]